MEGGGDATAASHALAALPPDVMLYVSAAALAAPEYIDAEQDDEEEHDAASTPDDSSDESWVEGDSDSDSDAAHALSSRVASDSVAVGSGTTPTSSTRAHAAAAGIVRDDPCQEHCLQGKEGAVEKFLVALWSLSSDQRNATIMSVLAILMETDTAVRHRGQGVRSRFFYIVPLVGRVCREVFCACFDLSAPTIARFKARIRDGCFSPKLHGNTGNTHAVAVDLNWLVLWYMDLAAQVGDVVPVRVRRQKTEGGEVIRYFSAQDFTLLPAYFTWRRLHDEMESFVEQGELDVRTPALSTMRKLLQKHCPRIKIRSPRSNVCDVCSIYVNQMRAQATSDIAEEFGRHTEAARRMRHEYQDNMKSADETHAVLVMDFSQSLTVPNSTNQPSAWYFMSLWSVIVFGIYCGNDGVQTNYVYDERTAGKGSDEVNSMLLCYLRRLVEKGYSKVTLYADNCTGQNKNNYVVKLLVALAHMGDFEEVNLKFFIKGHTKNAVDRGFTHIRKKTSKEDTWTLAQLLDVVDSASTSNRTVHLEQGSTIFKNFKEILTELYKDVPSILKYQLFRTTQAKPGVIECRVSPDEQPTECLLSRKANGVVTDSPKVQAMMKMHLPTMSPPAPNAKKIAQIHDKVRPFVPVEFQQDVYYQPPTVDQQQAAPIIKRARAQKYNSKTRQASDWGASESKEDCSAQPKSKKSKKKATKAATSAS